MMNSCIAKCVRLLVNARKEPYLLYRGILGFYPLDLHYYDMAMLSRSTLMRDKEGHAINNERLEFLGDAILEAIVTDQLYRKYPQKKEGFLTMLRSNIVQRKTLNKIGIKIGLNHLAKSMGHTRSFNIYGNALEALIGAIYLDRGYKYAYRFVINRVLENVDMNKIEEDGGNDKVSLYEWCQKNRYTIRFDTVADENNGRRFVAQVYINEIFFGKGTAFNKKDAQLHASTDAYAKIKNNHPLLNQLESIVTDNQ